MKEVELGICLLLLSWYEIMEYEKQVNESTYSFIGI